MLQNSYVCLLKRHMHMLVILDFSRINQSVNLIDTVGPPLSEHLCAS